MSKLDSFAPLALFAYNRPLHLKRVVDSLLENPESSKTDLFVFSDGARTAPHIQNVEKVRSYIETVTGFRSINVIKRERNFGLSRSVVSGVSAVCDYAGRVIVIEDDLVVSPYFLQYMNEGLSFYETNDRVASILGYALPLSGELPETYFIRGADCYGWGTWKRAWDLFEPDGNLLLNQLIKENLCGALDMNGALAFTKMLKDQIQGKNDSWAIRWHVSMFLRGMLSLTPNKSLIMNIGNDGSGINFGKESLLDTTLSLRPIQISSIDVLEHQLARAATEKYYSKYKSLTGRIIRKIFNLLS